MTDVMLDIETMGVTPMAAIIQIGAVAFDRKTGEIEETFKQNIDLASCVDAGYKIDKSTQDWWKKQNPVVLKAILDNGAPVQDAVINFSKFISRFEETPIWSHSTFDFPIVNKYLKDFKCNAMDFRQARDIRTLVDLSGIDLSKYDWAKSKTHDALDDCFFQIKYCRDAFNLL